MTDLLGLLGRYGPVHRTTAGRYRAWCPGCGHHGALLIVSGLAGERPQSCVNGCLVIDVVHALKILDRQEAA